MRIQSFSDVVNKIDGRMQSVRKVEHVISEILDRVLKNQEIPIPRIEVDTDMNVNLVYDLKSTPQNRGNGSVNGHIPRPYQQRRNQTQNLLL